jgi:hypothetical protein
MSEQAEAATCAHTPRRLWACGAGCPRLEAGGPRSVSFLPAPVHAERGGLTLVHQNGR